MDATGDLKPHFVGPRVRTEFKLATLRKGKRRGLPQARIGKGQADAYMSSYAPLLLVAELTLTRLHRNRDLALEQTLGARTLSDLAGRRIQGGHRTLEVASPAHPKDQERDADA